MIRITQTVTYEFDPAPTAIEPPVSNQTKQPEAKSFFDSVFGGVKEEVAREKARGSW